MNTNKTLKDLLHHHKVGTDYITKALSIDESSGNKLLKSKMKFFLNITTMIII